MKKEIETIKISEDLEKEVYNHLINFFSRYYDRGDFITKRRYGKKERYIIPYNGEEVLLYWANKDQYYIKTTEYFKKYTFRVKGLTVNFKILEAQEEIGNIKAKSKKFFLLSQKIFDYDEDKKVLNIYFEYRALDKDEQKKYGTKNVQDKINEDIILTLREKIPKKSYAEYIFEKENGKTIIQKHLNRYTKRNTMDYFIHKDLKGFLERELDFYIKNEVLDIENLENISDTEFKNYLRVAKVMKKMANKIIEFLAQIENFQKKLWEKKKFVIRTEYVITLDRIKEYAGEEFLESIIGEILNNRDQLDEWKKLFNVEVKKREDLIERITVDGYIEWKKLPIDTRYFDDQFKWRLLASITQKNALDEILDGILIKSENFHALNLLLNKYYGKIQVIYIDPPFNKEQDADYLYRVDYKDSTWITLLENRIRLAKELLSDRGSIFIRCDYNGNMYVRLLMNEIFGKNNFRNEIIVRRGSPKAGLFLQFKELKSLGVTYDNLYWYTKNPDIGYTGFTKKASEKQMKGYWTSFKKIYDRPTMRYELLGIKLKNGQWMWKKERALKAVKNYQEYLRISKTTGETLEEYWLRTGKKLEFVRRHGNTIQYWVPPKEFVLLDNNWTDIPSYASKWGFKTENHEQLLKRVIKSVSEPKDIVMDFFLGSGTTTAVAHKLGRRWIGIEIGEHFWSIILPRMKKVLFYDESGISKDDEVKEIYNSKNAGGFFKYQYLEQYEDTLENIEFKVPQKRLYEFEDYMIRYMLDFETRDSKTFLNLEEVCDPFNYKIWIIENYRPKLVSVDLIETFNYLIGIWIEKYKILKDNGRKYIFVFGKKDDKKIVVIWRNVMNIDFERDKKVIEENIRGYEPNEIYVNGDCAVKNFKPIEDIFKKLLFEVNY